MPILRPATPDELQRIEQQKINAQALQNLVERRAKEQLIEIKKPVHNGREGPEGLVMEPPKRKAVD